MKKTLLIIYIIFFGLLINVSAQNNPDSKSNKAISYELDQNYPNPFNPSTTIKYALPQPGFVTLKVYNMLGQEVKTLVNEFKEAGTHTVEFKAEDLMTGMYFYKIQVGDFSQVKKMTLLK